MGAADYRVMTDATGQRIANALETFNAVPFVATITTGQWSGSGSDRYITVSASNVTANSILIPHYDHASEAYLNGPVWCVPAAGSFTIHTSALPSGTVTIMVQFVGTMGTAQYQVLSDVYSTSQVDSLIAQSTANASQFQAGDTIYIQPCIVMKANSAKDKYFGSFSLPKDAAGRTISFLSAAQYGTIFSDGLSHTLDFTNVAVSEIKNADVMFTIPATGITDSNSWMWIRFLARLSFS